MQNTCQVLTVKLHNYGSEMIIVYGCTYNIHSTNFRIQDGGGSSGLTYNSSCVQDTHVYMNMQYICIHRMYISVWIRCLILASSLH